MKGNIVNPALQSLKNRLGKNLKKLKTYLNRNNIQAYRLYNKDIPEYPYIIDIYNNHAVIYEQGKKLGEENQNLREAHQNDIQEALTEVLTIPNNFQHFKIRQKQKGLEQYEALNKSSQDFFTIEESELKFWVNLERYLDTGLFLDHRPLRDFLRKNSKGKKILNLFCYTGSISTAAAKGGGEVTSVDMSNTYLNWAYENFLLNDIDPKEHVFHQADVLKDLKTRKENGELFDIIVLDPPSFSNSKRMEDVLDIERDHPLLIRDTMALLKKDGTLYFSTNKRKFELHTIVSDNYLVKEISHWTIPQDFHQSHIHRAFSIQYRS